MSFNVFFQICVIMTCSSGHQAWNMCFNWFSDLFHNDCSDNGCLSRHLSVTCVLMCFQICVIMTCSSQHQSWYMCLMCFTDLFHDDCSNYGCLSWHQSWKTCLMCFSDLFHNDCSDNGCSSRRLFCYLWRMSRHSGSA